MAEIRCRGCADAERGEPREGQTHHRDCDHYDAFWDASDAELAAMVRPFPMVRPPAAPGVPE